VTCGGAKGPGGLTVSVRGIGSPLRLLAREGAFHRGPERRSGYCGEDCAVRGQTWRRSNPHTARGSGGTNTDGSRQATAVPLMTPRREPLKRAEGLERNVGGVPSVRKREITPSLNQRMRLSRRTSRDLKSSGKKRRVGQSSAADRS